VDEEADFAAFVAARGPALLRLAVLLTADAEAAQDIVQEALVRVLPRWSQIAGRGSSPEAYVRTAVRSVWIDSWRKRRLEVVGEPRDDALVVHEDSPGGAAVRLSIEAALARLTVRQRTVLVLRFYEDLTEVETARLMRCSVSTVKTQTRHALNRLRVVAPDLVLLREGGTPGSEPPGSPGSPGPPGSPGSGTPDSGMPMLAPGVTR
jgi:RNA polymerase sigma-70 factor (sigma-E family)